MFDWPAKPPSAFDEREMERLKTMVDDGVAVAVPAALDYCQRYNCRPPEWLLAASVAMLCILMKGEEPRKRGRATNHIARFRQDKIDYSRWSTVVWARESQQEIAKQAEDIKGRADYPASYRRDREKLAAWYGHTLDRAFQCAAALLEGNESFGSPDAIKRSYFKVIRIQKDPRQTTRYGYIDVHFLPKLGLKWEPFVRPGRKDGPLHNIPI
jgi:hypothetical protein